jgi:GH25 family lysozyme M1 (1,4-beta-N-acetylmuramidase)/exopolysaccharide biosynthesis protein
MGQFNDALIRLLIRTAGVRAYNLFATDTRPARAQAMDVVQLYTGPIHTPASYDISHWKIVNDWANIVPHPVLMGTKATQGTGYKDPTFPEYFQKMKDIVKCRRLAYHFFEKTMDPVQQANWFVDYIQPYITDEDILCLDFEQGGETAPQLWAWCDRVHTRKPNNLIIIYSRKNLADPIAMNASEAGYFKEHPFWTAGYPTDWTQYTTTPPGYIPNQSKWGPVWLWQYTDSGHPEGIEGDTDCNLVEQPFLEWLGASVPPATEDEVTAPFKGVDRIVGRRFNSDVYITIMDPTMVTFQVAHETPFENGLFRTSDVCKTRSAQLGWNGDEWDKAAPLPAYPKNFAMADGALYVPRKTAEPSFCVRSDGSCFISHQTTGGVKHASTGRRYLIENGVIKDYLSGTEPQYTERHPRGLLGITQNGEVIMVTVDGRSDRSAGVTLKEGAQILKEFGAYTAFDRGGGGDAVDVIDGVVQNVPCDTGSNGQPGVERAIPQSILAYAQKESDMSDKRYDATALGDGTRIRLDHNTAANYVNSYPRGTVFSGNEIFTATVQLSNANGVYQKVGDKWLRVELVNGQPPKDSAGAVITVPVWVALIHMGSAYCTVVDNGAPTDPTDPPPAGAMHVVFTADIEGYKPLTLEGDAEPA